MSSEKEIVISVKDEKSQIKANEKINVNVKTCQNCGHVFVEGYHGSLGLQFWLTTLTLVGGIAYWALRGRGERCPRCKKRHFDGQDLTVTVGAPGNESRSRL